MKIKTRPWHDVRETIRQISDATPDHFHIDADWNGFLNNASNAVPVLRELEQSFPKIKIFEDPIPRNDAPGNRFLRTQIESAIAHHYGSIPAHAGLAMGGVCDGWVIGGGVSRITRDAHVAAEANMPFFLQMVGAGPTTTLSLHLSAVLTHAQWPTVTCHELYEHSLLTSRIPVVGGHARVPEGPGLGIEIDEAALDRYRVEEADHSLPHRLIKLTRPGGVNLYFATQRQMWEFFEPRQPAGGRLGLHHGAAGRRWQRRVRRPAPARSGIAGPRRPLSDCGRRLLTLSSIVRVLFQPDVDFERS